MKAGYGREHRFRGGHRGQSCAGAQRRHARHRRRPGLARGSAQHQHVTETSLVRRRGPRTDQRRDIARGNQVELERRNDGFVW